MHRRVQAATLAAVTLAVLLLGLPLAIGAIVLQEAQARTSAASRADAVLSAVGARQRAGEGVGAADLGRPASTRWPTRVTVDLPGGRTVTTGGGADGSGARASATDGRGTTVSVLVPRSAVLVADAHLVVLVVALAAGAVAAGWVVGLVQASRLTRPLADLARRAEQLGSGQVPASAGHSGIKEVDLVARALARSAQQLAARLADEREFAVDVSHQLRTPLTALSMRLEEIESATSEPDVAEEARTGLAQVERLTGVVEDLLARARARPTGPAAPLPLADVLEQQRREWTPVFTRAGRRLEVHAAAGAPLRVRVSPGPLAQALATLVENSLVHGAGTTRVSAREGREWVVVEVDDAGPGIPDPLARHVFERRVSGADRSGLGLALARDLLVAEGGRLELVRARPAVFALFLPAAGEDPAPA